MSTGGAPCCSARAAGHLLPRSEPASPVESVSTHARVPAANARRRVAHGRACALLPAERRRARAAGHLLPAVGACISAESVHPRPRSANARRRAPYARGDRPVVVCRPDSRGRRRLDHPDDFIRHQVAPALERGKRVVPVLVDGSMFPLRRTFQSICARCVSAGRVASRPFVGQRHPHGVAALDGILTTTPAPAARARVSRPGSLLSRLNAAWRVLFRVVQVPIAGACSCPDVPGTPRTTRRRRHLACHSSSSLVVAHGGVRPNSNLCQTQTPASAATAAPGPPGVGGRGRGSVHLPHECRSRPRQAIPDGPPRCATRVDAVALFPHADACQHGHGGTRAAGCRPSTRYARSGRSGRGRGCTSSAWMHEATAGSDTRRPAALRDMETPSTGSHLEKCDESRCDPFRSRSTSRSASPSRPGSTSP